MTALTAAAVWLQPVLLATLALRVAAGDAEAPWLAPIVHTEADYHQPLRFGDEVSVEVVSAELKERSMTIGFVIRATASQKICVTGKTSHVFVERATMKACPVPAAVKSIFATRPKF